MTEAARTPAPAATVAICTRNRPALVARALDGVARLDPAPADILVVDNAPVDRRTRDVVGNRPRVRYVVEPRPGLNHARNRCIAEAGTPLTVFLDDDAVPDPEWLGVLAARFRRPALAACVSRVEPYDATTPGARVFERAGGLYRGTTSVLLPRDAGRRLRGRRVPLVAWIVELAVGCGLAVRTDAVRDHGGFDPRFGTRPNLPGGDELDMLWRLLRGGWEVAYEPDARVLHEHRADVEAVSRQISGYQRGTAAFLSKALLEAPLRDKPGILYTLAWRTAKPWLRLARSVVGRDPLPSRLLLDMGWHTLAGPAAYLSARIPDDPAETGDGLGPHLHTPS